MSTGFVLNIDDKLLKNLERADELVQDIGKHSEQTEKLFNTAFAKMTTGSLDDFVQKLMSARQAIQDIGDAKVSDKGLGSISTQATYGADAVNNLVLSITQLMQVVQGKQKIQPIDVSSIQEASGRVTEMQRQIIASQQLFRDQIDKLSRQSLDEQQYQHEMSKMREFYEEQAKLAKQTETEKVKEAKKAAKEREKIAREIAKAEEKAAKEAAKAAEKARIAELTTFEGAMDFSKSTKSIKDQIQAIKYLKAARENLSKEGMSEADYRKKVKELTDEIKRQQKEVDKLVGKNSDLGKSHKSLINTADQLKRAFALMFSVSAIRGYVTQIARVRGEFELQQRSLQAILQNKDEADRLWQQTIQLAVRSPFQVKELVTYTKQLAAYRVESDKLYDTTKMLADVSAGLGVDMNRLILAYGQVKAANYLRGTELRQFSEAGVNILAELAKYFTEVEGRAVSVGEVFERVSKRMVTFADVEEIFKRITSEGGVFYNMQEVQAETLKGQISNLRDAIDIMLNDIGKSNEGVLKTVVGLIRTLIENWRGLSAILEPVFFIAIASSVVKFGKGISLVGDALLEATISGKGFLAMGAKIKTMTMQLWATIAANPILALIAVVASLVVGLVKYNNVVKEANKEYDDLSQRELRRTKNLEDYTKKINENNNAIEKNTNNETELKKARAANDELLSKIKREYPELYQSITQQTNGIVDMTKAIENQNKQMRINIALQQNAKGGWFQDTLSENYKDALEAQKKLSSIIVQIQSFAAQQQIKLTNAFNEGKITDTQYEKLNSVLKQTVDADDYYELANALQNIEKLDFGGVSGSVKKLFRAFDDLKTLLTGVGQGGLNSALNNLYDNLDNQMFAFQAGVTDIVALNPEKGAEKAGEWVDSQLVALGIVDKEIKKFAREYVSSKIVGVKLSFTDAKDDKIYTEQDLTQEWQKKLWSAIKDIEKANPEIRVGVSLKELATGDKTSIINDLRKTVPELQKIFGEIAKLNPTSDQLWQSPEQIKQAKDAIRPLQKLADLLALINKERGKDTEKEKITAQISLIKEMNKEYEKLRKENSKIDASDKIREYFKGTAQSVGLDISESLFDDDGTKESLEKLLAQASERLRPLVQKALDNVEVDIYFTTKAEQNKQLKQKVEDLFSQYDLSRELEKLGLSEDLMKSLFDVEYLDLASLKSKVIEKFAGTSEELQTELKKDVSAIDWAKMGKLIGEERAKEAKQSIEKITDMEAKAAKERVKTYVKYLMESQREAVKIKIEELRKLKEVEESNAFSPEQKEEIKNRIRKETNADLQKQEWADFQNSEMYTMMFEDLEHYGSQALETLREKLIALKGSLTDLPASEVKEIINQLSKIEDITIERNPFRALKETRKQINAEGVTEEQAQTNLAQSENKIAKLQSELDIINIVNTARSKGLAIDKETQYAYDDIVVEMEDMGVAEADIVKTKEKSLKLEKENAKTAKQQAKNYADLDKERVAALNKTKNILGSIQDATKASMELMDSLGVSSDSVAYSLAEGVDGMISLTISAIEFSIQLEAMGIAANSALGIIGWIAIAIQAVATAISAIFKMHDAGLQKQIDKLAEQTEVLKEKFDALSEAVDNAYNTDQLRIAAAEGKQYTQQMISNYEKMKQLEEDKKKTDKDAVKEYEDNIKEQREALRELEQQIVSEATAGIFDNVADAASGFVDAWYDSFKEVGNGLKGLEDNFDEMFLNLAKQQATMQIAGRFAKQWERDLSKYINETDTELTKADAQKWAEEVKATFPALNDALEGFLGVITDGVGATGELSGLEKGIAGASEETVQVLSAYANSCRFLLSNINTTLSDFATKVFDTEENSNPILSQLRIVAQQTTAINSLLSSLTKGGHTEGGLGLKVFIN